MAGTMIPSTTLVGVGAITASTTQTLVGGTVPTAFYTAVTCANISDAVTLPKGAPGAMLLLRGGANAGLLFPPTTAGSLNGTTAGNSVALAAAKTLLVIYSSDVDAAVVTGAI